MKPDILPPMPTTPLRDDEYWRWFPRLNGWVLLVRESEGVLWPDDGTYRCSVLGSRADERLWPDDYLWPKD